MCTESSWKGVRAMAARASLLFVIAAVALSTAACGKDSTAPDPPPLVSGSWSGSSAGITLNLTLQEGTDGAVSGSGNMDSGYDNLALVVRQGTHVDPNLTLILGATGYEDMNFTATVTSATQMAGTLNGSGFSDFDLNLAKR